ncbi:hypothetical protein [Bdellovibrio sp. HCB2-146]|uniref:hypothetical protein n=1 Tax=Bdellovibrio sp. HCB2-146 TaxID=3394362 RepID=UPI0039BD1B70
MMRSDGIPSTQCVKASFDQGSQVNTGGCLAKAQKLVKACEQTKTDTAYWCDSNNDEGMGNVMNTASKLGVMAGAAASSSVTASCSAMADLSQAANGAIAAYKLKCSSYISDCAEACDTARNFLESNRECISAESASGSFTGFKGAVGVADISLQIEKSASSCKKMNANVADAQQAIVNYAQTAMNASQCANESAAVDNLAEMCKANPSFIGCGALTNVDCTSPTMASNKVCVCAKNPLDPTCNLDTTNRNPNPVAGGGGMFDSASTKTNGDGLSLGAGDLPGLPDIAQGQRPGGSSETIDGKQGGGSGLGGGDGGRGGLAGGGGGAAGSADPNGSQVNAGFYGGGGGGGGAWGSGGGRGRYGSGGGGSVNPNGQAVNPDLRQFLPGGKYDPKFRGLAGMSGPDGITGPNTSIWKKIQNRYQVMSPSLLP